MDEMSVWPDHSEDFGFIEDAQVGRDIKLKLFGLAGLIPWKRQVVRTTGQIYQAVERVLGDISGINVMHYLTHYGAPLPNGQTLNFNLVDLSDSPFDLRTKYVVRVG
jgi:hypothetical protein